MDKYFMAVNRLALDAKLPEGDKRWFGFNQSFENSDLDAMDIAEKIATGHAYTSWHIPSQRHSDNWQKSQFLAVDMDTGDERSSFKCLTQHDVVMNWGGLLHTTPSHTKEKPRCRVVFLLDRPITSPAAYSAASKFISQILGGDKVATDPSRFFYGNLNGQIEMLNNELSTDFLYTLYKRQMSNRKGASMVAKDAHYNAVSTRSPTNYNTSQEKEQAIAVALARINPWDVDYTDWCKIIAAVKHELGDSGLGLAISWANGKDGEVEKKWRSFKRTDGNISTLGTILHFARAH